MGKCEFCGKEIVLPFRCSFCGKYFCGEHKLPENHQCSDMPSVHVHAKQRVSRMQTTERLESICPKCKSTFTEVQSFNKESVDVQCTVCGFKWTQPRFKGAEPKSTPQEPTTRQKDLEKVSLSEKILTIIVGSLISIGGLAIVLWEIYNPWFWTIFFIWVIPIPLVLIGIGILVFGILVAIAGALHR